MGALLAPDEEPAFEVREGSGLVVIVCEHASNRIPRALGSLGLRPADLERHIAWDPGAADLASRLAGRLEGALLLQRYSRLVVDCNRDLSLPDAITESSEDTEIPGNLGLSAPARTDRIKALWEPFHAAVAKLLEKRKTAGRATALLTVHSFTPVYRGVSRPWHVGIISTEARSFAEAMLAILRRDSGLKVGDNQPYSARDHVDYTIRRHGRDRGLPHAMVEVRNDLLRTGKDIASWTERLTEAVVEGAGAIGLASAKVGA